MVVFSLRCRPSGYAKGITMKSLYPGKSTFVKLLSPPSTCFPSVRLTVVHWHVHSQPNMLTDSNMQQPRPRPRPRWSATYLWQHYKSLSNSIHYKSLTNLFFVHLSLRSLFTQKGCTNHGIPSVSNCGGVVCCATSYGARFWQWVCSTCSCSCRHVQGNNCKQ